MGWGEIKKINNDMSKPLDVLIEEKTGAVNATGGTTTTGGIFAKLNKLLTDWTTTRAGKIDSIDTNVGTLMNGRVIKSIQRGVAIAPSSTTEISVAFSEVNISKSMVILNGMFGSSASAAPLLSSFSTNFMVLTPSISGISSSYKVSWQVIEFY